MINTILQSEKLEPVQDKILSAFSAHMAIIDAEGTILRTNESWQENQGRADALFHGRQVGDNYFDFCKQQIMEDSGHALEELLGLYSVIDGEKEHFTIRFPHTSPPDKVRWFKMKAISVDEHRSGLIIIHKEITDRVEQKKSLRENRERYEQQFAYSMDGILITSSTGYVIDGNPAASQILGYKSHQFKNLKREDLIVLSDPDYQQALEEREKTGAYQAEFQMKRSDGAVITVEASSRLYRTANGEKQAILNFRDITERKGTEAELVNEKRFTDSAVNSIPGVFFVMDPAGNIKRWNENLIHVFKYKPKELDNKSAFDLVIPEDRQKAKNIVQQIIETGSAEAELRTCSKEGDIYYHRYQGNLLEADGQSYIVGTGIDITTQKRVEAEKERHQAMMEQLFENSPIGIAMINKERQIMRTNRSFTDIFGYEKEEAAGQNIDRLLIHEDIKQEAEQLSNQGLEGDTFQVDTVRRAKDGSDVPVLIGGVPVEVNGELIALYGMYADITERKQLEERIRQLLEQEKENHQEVEQKKTKLQEIFTNTPSAICVLEGPEHKYTFANEAYERLSGKGQIEGKTVKELLPEVESQGFIELLDEVYSSGEPFYASETPIMLNRNSDDSLEEVFLNFIYKPMKKNGNIYGIFVEAIDVTQQVKNRRQLSRSLEEKEVLIREIHHRVKNNLALIASMIELQLDEAASKHETRSLFATKSRIHTIAKIQELIYKNGDLSYIPFDQFLENFSRFANSVHGTNAAPPHIDLHLQPVHLNVNQAVPFGLLINEILAKIEQHYSGKKSQKIKITLNCSDNFILMDLSYSDSNLDALPSFTEISSLNDTLIQTLCNQLNASLSCEQSGMHQQNVSLSFIKSRKAGSASNLNKL